MQINSFKTSETFWAKIYIAGPLEIIEQICREYVMKGECVQVTNTKYIYTMGEEKGVEIGFINYPRFPRSKEEIKERAIELGNMILDKTFQGSYTIVMPDETIFFSRRSDDV